LLRLVRVRAEAVRVVISAIDPEPSTGQAFPRELFWVRDPQLPDEIEITLPANGRAYVALQSVTLFEDDNRVLGAPVIPDFWISQPLTVTVEAWIGGSLADRREFSVNGAAPALYATVSEVA
jgi:hypothetical protein